MSFVPGSKGPGIETSQRVFPASYFLKVILSIRDLYLRWLTSGTANRKCSFSISFLYSPDLDFSCIGASHYAGRKAGPEGSYHAAIHNQSCYWRFWGRLEWRNRCLSGIITPEWTGLLDL